MLRNIYGAFNRIVLKRKKEKEINITSIEREYISEARYKNRKTTNITMFNLELNVYILITFLFCRGIL